MLSIQIFLHVFHVICIVKDFSDYSKIITFYYNVFR